eukprot:CAMPEP_0116911132 /NCGR_PEP_ID=MMETSP0467-20121206/15297_1 /TAXON_ID=283647 /ORGANISM="Mesodinium pulex, Strain SPMC105" /LENGTH=106 /DNA_ID=CAMNT_0004586839 /DNA_START=243 /DNA_END=563 /DNA_ORIENTATION=+
MAKDLHNKCSMIEELKLKLDKSKQKHKSEIKQYQSEISEFKTTKDTNNKHINNKNNEIEDLKKKIKNIFDKNEKDRLKAKKLFSRMFKADPKQTSQADQKALDAII